MAVAVFGVSVMALFRLETAATPTGFMHAPIRVTWPANQAMVLSPTPDTATE